MLICACRRG